jgi:hypothetical protein
MIGIDMAAVGAASETICAENFQASLTGVSRTGKNWRTFGGFAVEDDGILWNAWAFAPKGGKAALVSAKVFRPQLLRPASPWVELLEAVNGVEAAGCDRFSFDAIAPPCSHLKHGRVRLVTHPAEHPGHMLLTAAIDRTVFGKIAGRNATAPKLVILGDPAVVEEQFFADLGDEFLDVSDDLVGGARRACWRRPLLATSWTDAAISAFSTYLATRQIGGV